jgi:hypothetical protein
MAYPYGSGYYSPRGPARGGMRSPRKRHEGTISSVLRSLFGDDDDYHDRRAYGSSDASYNHGPAYSHALYVSPYGSHGLTPNVSPYSSMQHGYATHGIQSSQTDLAYGSQAAQRPQWQPQGYYGYSGAAPTSLHSGYVNGVGMGNMTPSVMASVGPGYYQQTALGGSAMYRSQSWDPTHIHVMYSPRGHSRRSRRYRSRGCC